MIIKEAEFKYKEYLECPHYCGACYHTSTFTHKTYTCKDCNRDFAVPRSVKLSKPQFDPNSKPDFKKRS